jgi:hypothetical protein
MPKSMIQQAGNSNAALQEPSPNGDPSIHGAPSSLAVLEPASQLDRDNLHSRPEWRLACRVADSKRLAKSDLLPRFLLYVCELQLTGNAHEITEQRIGIHIFHRPHNYNPGEDNIVRSYARTLRKRLDEYFAAEGSSEPLRISIPRGAYVPTFHLASEPARDAQSAHDHSDLPFNDPSPTEPVAAPTTPPQDASVAHPRTRPASPRTSRPWLPLLSGVLIGILVASAAWLYHSSRHASSTPAETPSAAHPMWAELFSPHRNTFIVPADSGLGILQNLTGHPVTLEEYANGSYHTDIKPAPGLDLANLNDLRRQRYTSIVDLNITNQLIRLPEFTPATAQVRYARSITTDDLKHHNAILIGSVHSNPWVALFEKELNFKPQYLREVDQSFITNQHPLPNEQATYLNGSGDHANRTYGVIDYLPSLDGTGHVLIIQGLNMAATQAAADILFHPATISPLLKQATNPDGSIKPFELLVEATSIGGTAPRGQIVATRIFSR